MENNINFYDKLLKDKRSKKFIGYFQSYKYFQKNWEKIKSDFTFKEKLSDKAQILQTKIFSENSVCISIRRGDFISNTNKVLNVLDLKYYKKAIDFLTSSEKNLQFYFFSDDINWCKENFSFLDNIIVVDEYYNGKKFRDKFELMMSCKHMIIPNSSFAWWAAFLNYHSNLNEGNLIIAPQNWFYNINSNIEDIIPSSWHKI